MIKDLITSKTLKVFLRNSAQSQKPSNSKFKTSFKYAAKFLTKNLQQENIDLLEAEKASLECIVRSNNQN